MQQLTFWGAAWPSVTFQWKTEWSVTMPSVESLIQVQKETSSFMTCDPSLLLLARLKTWSWRPAAE